MCFCFCFSIFIAVTIINKNTGEMIKCHSFANYRPKLSIAEPCSKSNILKAPSPSINLIVSSNDSTSTTTSQRYFAQVNLGSSSKASQRDSGRHSSSSSETTQPTNSHTDKTSLSSKDPAALIALEQLASISSPSCMKRMAPTLPQDLLAQNKSLLCGNRPISNKLVNSRKTSNKRNHNQYDPSNRCPLCSKNYRSQSHLNEHMRKEHSILI